MAHPITPPNRDPQRQPAHAVPKPWSRHACLVVALLLLPAAAQADFIRIENGKFVERGVPFRFIGFNIRGIAHYGDPNILFWSTAAHRDQNLDVVEDVGGRVIRAFVSHKSLTTPQTITRLQTLFDDCRPRGISVIVCLTDFFSTGFNPAGDEVYYVNAGTYNILGNEFYAGGFRNNYLPHAVALAQAFRNETAIFAWEIGNELRNDPNQTLFIDFCLEAATAIRAEDPNHLLTTGVQGTQILFVPHSEKVRLYSGFDFLTQHNYDQGDYENEAYLSVTVGKPYILEEAGMSSGDRPNRTHLDIAKWMGRDAQGYMQWGLMASTHDNGDGDRKFGMDRVFQTDWNEYLAVYSTWAQLFADEQPAVTPTPTLTATPAPPATPTPTPRPLQPSLMTY